MLAEMIPTTLTMRAPRMDDVDAIVELFNAHSRDLFNETPHYAEDFTSLWTAPGYNLETDARVVVTPEDQLVGYIHIQDMAPPHVLVQMGGRVHLDYRRQGIGTRLMEWAENRARQAVDKAPEGTRVLLQGGCSSVDVSTQALYKAQGFEPIRHFFRMLIEFDSAPPAPE
ncbi:MAG: hypothetical protein Fur0022_36930 [Anaerolineales bacterium]